jgi:translocation and assembly module TamB
VSRSSRLLRRLSLAIALPLALATAALAWLAYTEAGLARVVALLGSLEAVDLRIEGARGTLAGPLHLDALEWQAGRITLRASSVELEHDLPALAFGRMAVRRLEVGSLRLDVGPASEPAAAELRFLPRWLSLGLDELRVEELVLGLPGGSEQRYRGVTARGRVTHSRIDLDEVAADAGLWAAQGKVRLVARRPLRLRGELDWSVPGDPALQGTLRARGDLSRLDASVELLAPARASADVTLLDLDSRLRWEARIDADGFDLSPWAAAAPFGPLTGFLEGQGDLDALEVKGHLDGRGLPAAGLDLASAMTREGETLGISALRIGTPDGRLSSTTSGTLRLGEARALQLGAVWSGLAWPLEGTPAVVSPRGELRLAGWDRLAFELDATVAGPGVPEVQVVAAGQADRDGVTVTQSRLRGDAGRAEATGYLGFVAGVPWSLVASLEEVDLGRFRPGLDSRLMTRVAGSGFGLGADQAWAAHVGPLRGTLRGHAVSGTAYVSFVRGRYDFRELDLRAGPAHLEAEGHIGTDTAFVGRLDVPDLAGLSDEAGGSLEATLSARATGASAPGLAGAHLDVALRGRDLRWRGQRAAVLSADADLDLGDRGESWVRLRAAGLTLADQPVSFVRLSLDGLVRQHAFELQVGAGDRAASLLGSGRYGDGAYRLTADRIDSDAPRLQPYALEAPMELLVRDGTARLGETCLVNPPRRICLQGDWEAARGWSASASVADFPLEALRVDLPRQPGYQGVLDLSLRAAGAPSAPWTANARGTLREARLNYRTPSGRLEQLDLGVTNLVVESRPDRHELSFITEDTDALQLRGFASIPRDADRTLGEAPLRGSVVLATTRLGLLPLLVPDIDRADGRLRADLSLSGTPASPALGGTVTLEDGELDFYPTNLRLRQVTAQVTLLDSGLRIVADGAAGDGTFRTDGTLSWQDRVLRGDLRLAGERLLVADVPEARVEASPDLTFRVDGRDVTVQGSVSVPRARIEPRQLVGAVLTSPDEVIAGREAGPAAADRYRLRSDLRLLVGNDVRLSAFGLRGRLEGSVRAQVTPEEVATASGELEVRDGKYRAYGKELDVERGRLLFAGGPVADPGVDLRARKNLPGYEVGVVVRGRLRRPELSLYSVPALPQSQIASLLLVGRRLDNLDPGDRRALGGSSGDVATQGGALLAGQLGRAIGLDEVSVETGADASSSLVIGKFLSPRLYVSYGISLTDAINTFKLRYTVGDRWVVAVEAGEQASADVEYTIDR